MKYIRPKYGRAILDLSKYEFVGETDKEYMFSKIFKNGRESKLVKLIAKKAVLKAADKIDDLIDGYVVIKKNHHVYYDKNVWNTSHKLLLADIKDGTKRCMSGIWTCKGFVFVAELNSEGEWKLL